MKASSGFSADDDCEKLNKALTVEQGGGRMKAVAAIIPRRSNAQRQQLKAAYEQKYKKVGNQQRFSAIVLYLSYLKQAVTG